MDRPRDGLHEDSAVKSNVSWLGACNAAPEHAAERDEVVQDALQAIDRITIIVDELRLNNHAPGLGGGNR